MKFLTTAIFQEFLFANSAWRKLELRRLLCLSSTYSSSLDQEMTYFFCPLFVLQSGISNVICDLVLLIFREGIKNIISAVWCCSFPVFTVVEVHSSALRSTGSQFVFLKCDGLIWPGGGSPKQKCMHLFWAIGNLAFKDLLSRTTTTYIHSQNVVYKRL